MQNFDILKRPPIQSIYVYYNVLPIRIHIQDHCKHLSPESENAVKSVTRIK